MVKVRLYLIGSALLTFAMLPIAVAEDTALSEAEIYKMESGSKDFVIDLIAAGIWTKDCEQYQQFKKYDPTAKLNIPRWDETTKKYKVDDTFSITGAEYRRALSAAKAFSNYSKLDDDAQKRVNVELFGQEDKPEKGTEKYDAGIDRVRYLLHVISGEALMP